MKRKSTMVELVQELEKIRAGCRGEDRDRLDFLIQEAKAGEYHDYKNQKYTCGKVAVVTLLKGVGKAECDWLARRVMNGEFDEEADEEDKANLKKAALEGGFSEAQCKELFGL